MENRILRPTRRALRRTPGRTRPDAGFTLLEVMIAMVILAGVMVGFQASLGQRLAGDLQLQDTKNAAVQLATDRLRQVQIDPVYTQLISRYAATETNITGYTGFTRVTTLQQTTSSSNDYITVTVQVTSPKLKTPVFRTVVIAAP